MPYREDATLHWAAARQHVAGDLSEAEHYHISIGRQPGEGRFRGVGSDDGFDAGGSQDFAFNVDVGPDVVGDQSLFGRNLAAP